ncbi:MAG: DUF5915 domain-containing protein, partial [Eubacterium sp.]|nr:DUF5915 domain-containing protein [Eubacterium sp.]
QKMSKSKGNAVEPMGALEKFGADAIRWYFYINSAPWLPNKFHDKSVIEYSRRFMGTLWNTYAFFVQYANMDNFDATKYTLDYEKLPVMDKWLLSRLESTIKSTDSNLEAYRIPEAARALESFVDDMSNWYVRRSRERFWAKGMEQDKINAYMTLYTALVDLSKAAAPMIPFMTENIYRNLVCTVNGSAPESIHLCDYPTVNESWIDKDLEATMDDLMQIVVLGRAARNASNLKNRQPISRMLVQADFTLSDFYTDIIEDELNIKAVEFDDSLKVEYSIKPQLKTVGPKFGKLVGGIRKALGELDGAAAVAEVNANGTLKIDVNGESVELAKEDLLIEIAQTEGFVTESDQGITIMLDTNLTPELVEEGFVNEIISKIQTMRKDFGFEVQDHILVYAKDNEKIESVLEAHRAQIAAKVVADDIIFDRIAGFEKEWKINGEAVTLGIEKV